MLPSSVINDHLAFAGPHLSVATSSERVLCTPKLLHVRNGHVQRWNMSQRVGKYGVGDLKAL